MHSSNKKLYIAISCMASFVLVFVSFCNKNPLEGNLSARTGTVILKTALLDSIAAKEAKTEAISSMKASILRQGTQIATQTKNKEAGGASAQFTFTNLEPASGLTALAQVFDGSNERYRAESGGFNIVAGQTSPVTLNGWSISFDQTQTEFTVDPLSILADGITTAIVKLIPRYSGGSTMGDGMTVTFQSTLGTWLDNVVYNSSDQSYTRLIKSSTAGAATISALIKAGTANATTLTKTLSLSFTANLSITSDSILAAGAVGSPHSMPLTASGGTSPYSWSLDSGNLPGGLSLSSAGVISGTPTDSGTSTFTVKVEDSGNPKQSATKELSMTINPFSQYIEPQMVFVPAGSFQMGDNFNEGGSEERPVHTVTLGAYYIGKYEVTNAEYKKFMDDGGYTTQSYWTAGGFDQYGIQPGYWNSNVADGNNVHGGGLAGNENYPVVGISWYDAMAYCNWLSAKTGNDYRLPTEAEWEKAARGTDQRRYPWGNSLDGSYANYWDSGDYSDNGVTTVGYYDGSTHGGFATHDNASPCGAYDMAGNVWEWCYDWYSYDYYASSPANNPEGPSTGSDRLVRGGAWNGYSIFIRSAFRHIRYDPTYRGLHIGFRCLHDI